MSSISNRSWLVRVTPAIFVLLWSTGFLGSRLTLDYVEPMSFSATRFAIVLGLLILVSIIRRSSWPRSPAMWGHLIVTGLLIHGCFIAGMFYAINSGVEMSIAALIGGTQPLLTALIAIRLFDERLSGLQWSGFALGFIGLGMVVLKSLSLGSLDLTGFSVCLIALLGITVGTVYQKYYVVNVDLWASSAVQIGSALVPCAVWAFFWEHEGVEWNLTVILTMAWMCVALSIGAISLLFFMIRAGAVGKLSSLFYLVPPFTALQGYVLFGEQLTPVQLLGIAIVAAGVALINRVRYE